MAKRVNFFSVKLVKETAHNYDVDSLVIKSPDTAYEIIEKVYGMSDRTSEHFIMLTLNTKNKVIGIHPLHVGSINMSIVSPRDIFQHALLNNAASIIVAHNHPSGDVAPSPEDIETTKRIVQCGELMGVQLLDHIICGDNRYTSLKEKGYL